MSTSEPDAAALRAALEHLVDVLTPVESGGEPAHLARVRAAKQARAVAAEVAEEVLDQAILDARNARPQGATWAELGEALEVTGQAVSKRAGVRSLTRERRRLTPAEREQRRLQWLASLSGHVTAEPAERPGPPPRPAAVPARPAGTGAAFWRAQRQ